MYTKNYSCNIWMCITCVLYIFVYEVQIWVKGCDRRRRLRIEKRLQANVFPSKPVDYYFVNLPTPTANLPLNFTIIIVNCVYRTRVLCLRPCTKNALRTIVFVILSLRHTNLFKVGGVGGVGWPWAQRKRRGFRDGSGGGGERYQTSAAVYNKA